MWLRRVLLLLMVGLLTSLVSCVESKHPLAPLDKSEIDEALLGWWKHEEPTQIVLIHFGRPEKIANHPPGLLVLHSAKVSFDGKKMDTDPKAEYLIPVKLGDHTYLQFVALTQDEEVTDWKKVTIKNYMFLKYQVIDKKLEMVHADFNTAKKLVADGKLKDEKELNKKENLIRLTNSTEELNKFFSSKESQALFDDKHKTVYEKTPYRLEK